MDNEELGIRLQHKQHRLQHKRHKQTEIQEPARGRWHGQEQSKGPIPEQSCAIAKKSLFGTFKFNKKFKPRRQSLGSSYMGPAENLLASHVTRSLLGRLAIDAQYIASKA